MKVAEFKNLKLLDIVLLNGIEMRVDDIDRLRQLILFGKRWINMREVLLP